VFVELVEEEVFVVEETDTNTASVDVAAVEALSADSDHSGEREGDVTTTSRTNTVTGVTAGGTALTADCNLVPKISVKLPTPACRVGTVAEDQYTSW
jgi:hypothetical protein